MAETKITKDIVLRNDVLRLIENMKTALTPMNSVGWTPLC